MDQDKIKNWLKPKENKLLALLMVFTIIIRLYYFFKLGAQPIWWDEGDYLSIAKVWATGMDKPEWWGVFTGMRPLFIPLLWAAMMKIGLNEITIRFFTLFLPSVLTIYLIYAVGRDMYNKYVGLIAGTIMSVYWVHLFYSFRLLTDIPSLFFGMLIVYFFYSKYLVKGEKKGLYLAVLFGVIAFSARFPHALILVSCFVFLLFIQKSKFFKSKTNWKALGLVLLLLLPYIIYFIYTNFYAFQFVLANPDAKNFATPVSQAFKNIVLGLLPTLFGTDEAGNKIPIYKNIFLIFFFIGLASLYKLFLYFDIFWKQSDKRFNADFFIVLWILSQALFYIVLMRAANDRWLLMAIPALFLLTGKGFYIAWNYLKQYSKQFAIIAIIVLILLGGYSQVNHADALIMIKKDTYKEIKLAGEWLKENTPADAKIVTASIVQSQYYSERDTYNFYSFETNETLTQPLFEEKVAKINPDYYIINVFQDSGTPAWAYTYPVEKNLEVVHAYFASQEYEQIYGVPAGSPMLVIYKF